METWLILLAAVVCSATPLNQGGAEYPVLDNPEEVPGLFEGDIVLELGEDPTHKNAVGSSSKVWPGGVIPYVIQSSYSSARKKVIHDAMQELTDVTKVHGRTCIHFKPHAHETGYMYFANGTGCNSGIGYNNKERKVTLGHGCSSTGVIMHETLHALGFWHEQSSSDRDNFVTIHVDNVKHGMEYNFKKYEIPYITELGQPYDYASIMHYGRYTLSIDHSKPTIEPKQPDVNIGQRNHLSAIDIKKVQILYGCIPGAEKSSASGSFVTAPPDTTTAPPAGSDVCTFQSGLCHWKNVAGSQLHWTRHRGTIPNSYAGPVNDPTRSRSAYYVYIGDGHPHHTSRTAKLDSKTYPSGDYCVDFYYHLYSDESCTLYLNYVTPDHQVHHIKTMHGNPNHRWHHIQQHATVHTSHNFKFEFEGQIGSGSFSVIVLDNIVIHHGRC